MPTPAREMCMCAAHLGLVLNRQVQLELCRQLVLLVQTVREIHPPDATVRTDLRRRGDTFNTLSSHLVCGSVCERVKVCVCFQPSSSRMGMVQMKGLTRVVLW